MFRRVTFIFALLAAFRLGAADAATDPCAAAARLTREGAPIEPVGKSGVDLAWKVLGRRITADNFGSRIAKLYFAVVAVVGNNSGNDIQVASVYFRLPDSMGLAAPVPADPHRIVRGTLEREQQVGLRASTLHVVKALGPMLTGSSVFIGGNRFPEIINVFTNPFEKGLELVFPDKTLRNMDALDNMVMRESTIISDNSQQVLLVFIGRDMIGQAGRKKDIEPAVVMRALGDMVLVGKSIQYLNRVTVASQGR